MKVEEKNSMASVAGAEGSACGATGGQNAAGERGPSAAQKAAAAHNRWPRPGDTMRFLARNGYDSELSQALDVFEPGALVVVRRCDVGDWRHTIEFEGLPGKWWNGVMFELVEPPAENGAADGAARVHSSIPPAEPPSPSPALTREEVESLICRLRVRINNPSAWDNYDEGASELIREAYHALSRLPLPAEPRPDVLREVVEALKAVRLAYTLAHVSQGIDPAGSASLRQADAALSRAQEVMGDDR